MLVAIAASPIGNNYYSVDRRQSSLTGNHNKSTQIRSSPILPLSGYSLE
jgi:hypothetical protein